MLNLCVVGTKTIKMRVGTTKSWFAIDSSGKLVFFSRHFYVLKRQLSILFLLKRKFHTGMAFV